MPNPGDDADPRARRLMALAHRAVTVPGPRRANVVQRHRGDRGFLRASILMSCAAVTSPSSPNAARRASRAPTARGWPAPRSRETATGSRRTAARAAIPARHSGPERAPCPGRLRAPRSPPRQLSASAAQSPASERSWQERTRPRAQGARAAGGNGSMLRSAAPKGRARSCSCSRRSRHRAAQLAPGLSHDVQQVARSP